MGSVRAPERHRTLKDVLYNWDLLKSKQRNLRPQQSLTELYAITVLRVSARLFSVNPHSNPLREMLLTASFKMQKMRLELSGLLKAIW